MLRRENLQGLYPLSPMQEGMLFHALRDPDSSAYVEQLSFRMKPAPSPAHFSEVWAALFQRHDILRTVFVHETADRPLQAVLKQAPPQIRFEDVSALPAPAQAARIGAWKDADRLSGFRLTAAPPIRITRFDLGDGACEVIFTHHHILMDGWCLGILHEEFVTAVAAVEAGKPVALPPTTPFAHYIEWLGTRDDAAARDYWRAQVSAEDQAIASPFRAAGSAAPASHSFALDATAGAALRALGIRAGATPATVLHALWGLLLGRLLDREDVTFGSVISNRPEAIPGVEAMLGLFINTVPVRLDCTGGASFIDLVGRLQQAMLARRPHEHLPLATIQAEAQGRTLFDHILLVQNYPLEQRLNADGARIDQVEVTEQTHYDLAVSAVPGGPGGTIQFRLDHDLARLPATEAARIERLMRHLVDCVIARPDTPIAELPLAPRAETAIAATPAASSPNSIVAMAEAAAAAHPDRIAVRCEGRSLSFGDLDGMANAIAHRLRAMVDLAADDRVVLLARRSEWLPAAMLGIAKAGAAYVPVDPDYPPDRIALLCRDSGARMVLAVAAPREAGALPEASLDAVPPGLPLLLIDAPLAPVAAPPSPGPSPGDLLYVAYTSGSTGQPKGVMVEHRSVAAFAETLAGVFGMTGQDRILALTTITFDISVLELLCSLAMGIGVAVATEAEATDPELALAAMAREGVTVLQATPSRLRLLLDVAGAALPAPLRLVLVGGEKLPPALASRLAALRGIEAFNVYGPTETTIWSSAERIAERPPTIGRPLPGERIVILSHNGRPCPVGVVGEIAIGGAGLARGYLGCPDLTGERHLPDPTQPGALLYRSGDLGLLRDDGRIEILGRADDQLKIRGHRIEPGEIEAALAALPGTRQALACARGEGDAAELIAYAAATPGTSPASLRAALAARLPAWMVPSHIVVLDAFPLLPSGKVDRRRLPAPEAIGGVAATPPRDALEARIAALFAEVLGGGTPGVEEDFFALGGHSLHAVQLLARLRREFSRDLPLLDILRAPSVRGIADRLRATVPAAVHAIPALPEAPHYALSPAQRRMWVLERMAPGTAYLLPAAFHIAGPLDLPALRGALDALVARHEALRTLFPLIDNEPRQVVLPPAPVPIAMIEAPEGDTARMRDFLSRPFALQEESALRVALLRHGPASHTLVFALHHIAADGHSLGILQRDLSRLHGLPPGRPAPPAPRHRYRDVAAWQNALLAEAAADRDYWHGLLAGELPASALVPDLPRPAIADPAGAVHRASLGLAESNTLRRLARARGATTFMAAATLVALLLHRQGEADVRLGFPVAGRTHHDLQDVVGVFVNTLVLRLRVDPDAPFATLLDAARDGVLGALAHQAYPFDRLVDELGIARDPGRSPIFDVMVSFEERAPGGLRLGGLRATPLPLPVTDSRFDLVFNFGENEDGGLLLALEYRTALFTAERIDRLVAQLRCLLQGLEDAPTSPVGDLPLLGQADQAIIAAANDTAAEVPRGTLAALLLDQVARSPDAMAVVDDERSLTYAGLALAAGGVAASLSRGGTLRPGTPVALLADRNTLAIAGLFGIVLAGGAWVPLDPALPEARMRALLADSGCEAVVAAGPGLAEQARGLGAFTVIDVAETAPACAMPALPLGVGPETLAYVIYTSGTTGTPKGVMIPHQAAVNLAFWLHRDMFGTHPADLRHAAMASLTFDACLQEVLGALRRGDTLVMVPASVKRDPALLDAYLWRHRVDVVGITPSQLSAALEAGLWATRCSVRVIEIGAETLTRALVGRLLAAPHRSGIEVWNVYGPTECCVDGIVHRVEPGEDGVTVPIGRPIPNMRVHLLDARLQPVPPGAVGEICIAGAGVALGYLGQPALSDERFVAVPALGEARVYRSGDYALRRADGVLHFLGRRDHQVKIRGYRIELAEIEQQLLRLPGIRTGVVLPESAESLACWYVASPDVDPTALRQALAAVLPPWMVPSSFTPVAALPLTVSGKLDRAALPAPRQAAPPDARPIGATEQALHDIWCVLLGRDAIGREEDFFTAGGNSLMALRLLAQLRARFGAELPLSTIFSRPTIAGLATHLPTDERAEEDAGAIRRVAEADSYPLTGPQRRLWLLARGDAAANAAYALPAAFLLDGALDHAAFEAALGDLLARHESLRTRFPEIGGEPLCVTAPADPVRIEVADLPDGDDPLAACRAAVAEPFDLTAGPAWRLRLWRLGDGRHLLLVALHHIIGDARSMDVLMRDLTDAYAHRLGLAAPRASLAVQARDIAAHEAALEATAVDAGLAYWRDKLQGPLPVLELPTDRPRPAQRGWAGATLATTLPPPLSSALEAMARSLDASTMVLLLALAKVQLHRLTGQADILVGSIVSRRDDAVLDDQIGFHVETVALRETLGPDLGFATLVAALRRTLDEAVAHRRCPFDRVVDAVAAGRDPSRNPLFDVMVVFQDAPAATSGAAPIGITPLPLVPPVSKLDLTFHLSRGPAGIGLALEFRTDLFDPARIGRMLAQFATLAQALADGGAATPVGALALLPDAERAALDGFAQGPVLPIPSGNIPAAFAAQVAAHAARPAVIAGPRVLTYAALQAEASAVAALLRDSGGLVPGEPVLVMLDRDATMPAALLGVMQAGGVYMPADRQHPPGRIAAMLRQSGCRLAIAEATPPGMARLAEAGGLTLYCLPDAAPAPLREPDAAYLIFTSGSTGQPKGVVVGHAGFLNMVARQIEVFGIRPEDRVLLFASPAFDASLSEAFMALLAGAALLPATAPTVADANALLPLLRQATVATLPPAYLAGLGRPDLGALRVLITAGEPPVPADLRHYATRLRYFNAYGPTESSVCATIWEVPAAGWPDADLPIGTPIGNTAIHVLDARLEPVPIGVPGEICIAGIGLAAGYLGDPAATARAFVTWRGTRLYRTGDRGTWRADGLLSYGGRIDQQIKIRGQRVEPAEVEAALLDQPGIAQAVVLPRGEGAERHLIAWVLPRPGATPPEESALRARLASTLPRAMLPRRIVPVAALPRTVNGKIDRDALPEPISPADEADAPRNAEEAILAEIFARALGLPAIGIHADFFELGGDSIRLLQVTAELGRRGLAIDIGEAYRTPSVAALAASLRQRTDAADQAHAVGPAPLTATQAWFFRGFTGNQSHFNQSALLRARKRIDPAALREALGALLAQHDALRLRIEVVDGRRRMVFPPPGAPPALAVHDLREDPAAEAAMTGRAEALQRGLDIADGPVMAAALFRLPAQDALLIAIHHLAVDAVSWRILVEDLCAALRDAAEGRDIALPARTHSFRDWAIQQARIASTTTLAAEYPHWEAICRDAVALPTGKGRATHHAVLSASALTGTGTEAALLAAYAAALAPRLGLESLVVMLEGHGRAPIAEGLDVGRTVGWFTSLYPLRLAPTGAVADARASLAAVPNRGVGFGILAELSPQGAALRLPPGGIAFNYLGDIGAPAAMDLFEPEIDSLGEPVDPEAPAPFAIDLLASLRGGSLHLALSHDTATLTPEAGGAVLAAMGAWLSGAMAEAGPSAARAPFTPYLARVADDAPLVLNAAAPVAVFAMPPLFGYGAAFRGLGERLPGAAFHAFDFIESEDRVDRYVAAIRARLAGRPFLLLGYSGGGNLGFAVARAATEAGCPPAALALLDAPMKRAVLRQEEAEIEATMDANLGYFRDRMQGDADYRAHVENAELRSMMLRRMGAFIRYLNGLVDEGRIGADIHLVRSAQQWSTPESWSGWAERTSGRLVIHQGSGDHAQMTDAAHVAGNAAIIAEILAGLPPA